jgi:anti-anti-sigma factor
MRCYTRQDHGNLFIKVKGGFHSQGIVTFCSTFSQVALSDYGNIVIDLSGVDYISFKAVGLLTEKMLAAEQAGSHCRLVNIGPEIRDMIGVTDSRNLTHLWATQEEYPFF